MYQIISINHCNKTVSTFNQQNASKLYTISQSVGLVHISCPLKHKGVNNIIKQTTQITEWSVQDYGNLTPFSHTVTHSLAISSRFQHSQTQSHA